MKRLYYSIFIPGLEKPIEAMLRKEGGVSIEKIFPGMAIYKSIREPHFSYFQRTFLMLYHGKSEKTIDSALRKISETDSWIDRFPFNEIKKQTFKIVTAINGQPCAANPRFLTKMEKIIYEQTGMVAVREKPEVELWINNQAEGLFFLWRLGTHSQKTIDPLRKDLCEIIAFLGSAQGKSCAVMGLTGDNLPDALLSQGAKKAVCFLSDHVTNYSGKKNPALKISEKSPACTGMDTECTDVVTVCVAPKKSMSLKKEQMRGVIREALRVLCVGGKLISFVPSDYLDELKKVQGCHIIYQYKVLLSGENCFVIVYEKM